MSIASRMTKALGAALSLVVLMLVAAPPSMAAPGLTTDKPVTGLTDGQEITITGSGFAPNLKGIAVGQCVEGYTGPAQCNISGGATFRDADAKGSIGTFKLKFKQKFGAHDCAKAKCLLAAGPLPTAESAAVVKANTYEIPMSFGGAAAAVPAADTSAREVTTATPTVTSVAADADELPKTGISDTLPVMIMGGVAMLFAGLGLRFVSGTRGRA